jgi:hypothetical protein
MKKMKKKTKVYSMRTMMGGEALTIMKKILVPKR